MSYIYISVEDSREFPSRVDEITRSNSRQTSGFMVFYGEIEDEEEEGSGIRVSKRRDRQIGKSKSESEKVKLEREYRLVFENSKIRN